MWLALKTARPPRPGGRLPLHTAVLTNTRDLWFPLFLGWRMCIWTLRHMHTIYIIQWNPPKTSIWSKFPKDWGCVILRGCNSSCVESFLSTNAHYIAQKNIFLDLINLQYNKNSLGSNPWPLSQKAKHCWLCSALTNSATTARFSPFICFSVKVDSIQVYDLYSSSSLVIKKCQKNDELYKPLLISPSLLWCKWVGFRAPNPECQISQYWECQIWNNRRWQQKVRTI